MSRPALSFVCLRKGFRFLIFDAAHAALEQVHV
jgi:hypothetical protein